MATKTHEIIAVLYACYNAEKKDLEFKFTDNKYWIGDTDIVIDEFFKTTIEVETLTQETFTQLAIKTLRDKQNKAFADAQQKVNDLEEKIKELQLLTWQSDVIKVDDFKLKEEEKYDFF